MDKVYYVCKLPAEKQHFRHHTPKTEYYGLRFMGENGTYRVASIIKKELSKIGNAAANHHLLGDRVVAGFPSREMLLKSKRHVHDPPLRLLVEKLARHHPDLEVLSVEELQTAGIEGITGR